MIEISYYDEEKTKLRSEIHKNGKGDRHREDGPSYQGWDESGQKQIEVWHLDGQWHRLDGPAYLDHGGGLRGSWYIYGKRV